MHIVSRAISVYPREIKKGDKSHNQLNYTHMQTVKLKNQMTLIQVATHRSTQICSTKMQHGSYARRRGEQSGHGLYRFGHRRPIIQYETE